MIINLKHTEKNSNTIYCGRGSIFGNPFRIGIDGDRNEVCDKHKNWLDAWKFNKQRILITIQGFNYCNQTVIENLYKLKGKNLGCYCAPERCHCEYLEQLVKQEV